MILNTPLLPSITRQFALKPQPPIVPVATDTVSNPIGDSFQKNTAIVPIPPQPKAGGRWLVALTPEQRFSENLNTAMRDIAIKDRLQEVVPTLTPEQLTFIPSEQIPIDETLLPTLKQLFPPHNPSS